MPDFRPLDFRPGELQVLAQISEGMIDRIEGRVGDGTDSRLSSAELVMTLYDIRRDLEEIHRWHRHFFPTPDTSLS